MTSISWDRTDIDLFLCWDVEVLLTADLMKYQIGLEVRLNASYSSISLFLVGSNTLRVYCAFLLLVICWTLFILCGYQVKSYCGHGIGELFHCAPNIPHYARIHQYWLLSITITACDFSVQSEGSTTAALVTYHTYISSVISPGFCTAQLCDAHLKDWRVVRSIGWRVSRRFEFNFDLSITVHDPKSNRFLLEYALLVLTNFQGTKLLELWRPGKPSQLNLWSMLVSLTVHLLNLLYRSKVHKETDRAL
jgi:hypothetical protein